MKASKATTNEQVPPAQRMSKKVVDQVNLRASSSLLLLSSSYLLLLLLLHLGCVQWHVSGVQHEHDDEADAVPAVLVGVGDEHDRGEVVQLHLPKVATLVLKKHRQHALMMMGMVMIMVLKKKRVKETVLKLCTSLAVSSHDSCCSVVRKGSLKARASISSSSHSAPSFLFRYLKVTSGVEDVVCCDGLGHVGVNAVA